MYAKLTTLLLTLALAAPLHAQTAETETDDGASAVENDLSTGTPAVTENQLGTAYTKEVSGDWEIRCVRTQTPEQDPCQLYQLLKDQSGNAVSEVSVFKLADGGEIVAGATVIVPLETLLTAQLTMAIDGANARRYPFSFCSQVGCYARLGLTDAEVTGFKRGAKAQVQIRPFAAPDQTVTVEMSLTGFTAGFDKIEAVASPN
ncbi:invasion associated locus B family protein [Primorskyibacter sp. S187A]|uniref:invasion associated locus B family protein n=1 Tax=Primorskyibacter sp. S187A TaxID=3415130 RepID=UPI003C7BA402